MKPEVPSPSHAFVVCAYKESPYLEACIRSLLAQGTPSPIVITTSTPNGFIRGVAEKYRLPLLVNEGEGGIVQDWNFAYRAVRTDLVTLAHQDDIYLPGYTREILRLMRGQKKPLILFTDYAELRGDSVTVRNSLLMIKRLLLLPLRLRIFWNCRFVRRRILSLGSPICCPAVTYVKRNLPDPVFSVGFRSDEDWEAWERLSRQQGGFIYSAKIGIYHRIHEGSETSAVLNENLRKEEDFTMFCKFWPAPVARLLGKLYSGSEKSNQLQTGEEE